MSIYYQDTANENLYESELQRHTKSIHNCNLTEFSYKYSRANFCLILTIFFNQQNSFIKSIKKPVRAQNYRHLHFTLTMILMISNIYNIYKKE